LNINQSFNAIFHLGAKQVSSLPDEELSQTNEKQIKLLDKVAWQPTHRV